MQLYRPQQTEVAAACALLRAHFPDAAGDIERGAGILPQLQYSTAADFNGSDLGQRLGYQVNQDPGFWFPGATGRINPNATDDFTPHAYHSDGDRCECWDFLIRGCRCRHAWAVRVYQMIINARLDALAQAGRLDLRPAGRYENLADVVTVWGRTLASVQYSPRLDRWRCETLRDVAFFAAWLATDEAEAEIWRGERGAYVPREY